MVSSREKRDAVLARDVRPGVAAAKTKCTSYRRQIRTRAVSARLCRLSCQTSVTENSCALAQAIMGAAFSAASAALLSGCRNRRTSFRLYRRFLRYRSSRVQTIHRRHWRQDAAMESDSNTADIGMENRNLSQESCDEMARAVEPISIGTTRAGALAPRNKHCLARRTKPAGIGAKGGRPPFSLPVSP